MSWSNLKFHVSLQVGENNNDDEAESVDETNKTAPVATPTAASDATTKSKKEVY